MMGRLVRTFSEEVVSKGLIKFSFHGTDMTLIKLTAKSLGTLSFTKLTYPVSPGHLPFLSTLYWSHLPVAEAAAALAAFCSAA